MDPSTSVEQQYSLKWNNHKVNLSGVFERLRQTEQFADCTLVSADEKTLACHKLVLSAGSG